MSLGNVRNLKNENNKIEKHLKFVLGIEQFVNKISQHETNP